MQHLTHLTTAAYVRASTAPAAWATALSARTRDEEGQTTAEYVAVIVMIAAIITVAATNDGIRTAIVDAIKAAFGNVEDKVTDA